MYDLVIIVFYIMFWLIGIWRKSLIMVVFNIIVAFAFYSETNNIVMTLILFIAVISQVLLTLRGE